MSESKYIVCEVESVHRPKVSLVTEDFNETVFILTLLFIIFIIESQFIKFTIEII